MEIKSKEQMNLYLLIIFIIITLTIVFYSYYQSSFKVVAKNLEVNFINSDIVDINNKLPISDSVGKESNKDGMEEGILSNTSFSITNPNDFRVKYEIYATKQSVSGIEMNGRYIKFYLTDENGKPYDAFDKEVLPTYASLLDVEDRKNTKLIYSGKVEALTTMYFNLKSWVADTYAINSTEQRFSYDVDIRMK